jgi:hypothetical protein
MHTLAQTIAVLLAIVFLALMIAEFVIRRYDP